MITSPISGGSVVVGARASRMARAGLAESVAADVSLLGWPLSVRRSGLGGLGVVATRDIRAGERLVSEAPLALTPLLGAAAAVCWHCLERAPAGAEQPLRCSGCRLVCWCSERCREAGTVVALTAGHAHAHGPTECAALASWETAGRPNEDVADLILQAVRLLDVRERAASFRPFPSPSATRLGFEAYEERLCDMKRNRENGDAIRRSALSAIDSAPAEARVDRALLEEVLSRHQCNVYGVSGPAAVGHGLASFVGILQLFNHSCAPNLAFDSRPAIPIACGEQGGFAVAGMDSEDARAPRLFTAPVPMYSLIALRNIRAGTELTHCYASSSDGPAARQEYLRAHHGFRCDCPRCACTDPLAELVVSERLDARRCIDPRCGSGLGVHVQDNSGQRQHEGDGVMLRCVHCGESWEADEEDLGDLGLDICASI